MTTSSPDHNHHHPNADAIDIFGFWIYILTDCVLFASLFTVYVVLRDSVYGLPTASDLADLPYVLGETFALLLSSFTYGMMVLSLYHKRYTLLINWLIATFLLGSLFIYMEIHEFIELYVSGYGWQASASLSAFFTLVGTHGLHVTIGLLWMLVMLGQLIKYKITPTITRRLTYLGMFWAFLDIVWIFVYTIVYLIGAI